MRERVEASRSQQHRESHLRLEISGWLQVRHVLYTPSQSLVIIQAIISDLEDGHEEGEQREKQEVVIRKLMRRKSKRETKAIWSEIRNGVLRRTNSVEDLGEAVETEITQITEVPSLKPQRVRHNSDGHYDDVKIASQKSEDNVYENVTFFQGSAKFGQTTKPGVKITEDWERLNTVTNNGTHLDRRSESADQNISRL